MADSTENENMEGDETGEETTEHEPEPPTTEDDEGLKGADIGADAEVPGTVEESVPLSGDESAPTGTSISSFTLKDEAVMKELMAAEEHATNTAALVETLKVAIFELSQKENLTEEDASLLQVKQHELMGKLAELETVTKRIQELIGLKNISSSILGPPMQCRDFAKDPCQAIKDLKTANLPKVIICGNESTNQIPKIIVCDPIDNNDPSKPVYQQFPGTPLAISEKQSAPSVNRGFLPPGAPEPCRNQYGMPSQGPPLNQQYVGSVPGPVRQMPAMMGQPPVMMGMPQMGMPQMGPPQMGMPQMGPPQMRMPQMGPPQMGMPQMGPPQMGRGRPSWPPGMGMGQQIRPQGFAEGFGSNEPYRPGPQEFGQPPNSGMNDTPFEEMKKQLESLQEEVKKLCSENEDLKKQLTVKVPEKPLCKMSLGKVPVCKLDIYNQMGLPLPKPGAQLTNTAPGQCKEILAASGGGGPKCKMELYRGMGLPVPGLGVGDGSTKDVETMVASMEEEVRSIQKELDGVQAERRSLELQKKMLQCVAPLVSQNGKMDTQPVPMQLPQGGGRTPGAPVASGSGGGSISELQYREMMEKYNKLQENFNLKVEEVSRLRVELDNSRRESTLSIEKTKEAEARVDDLLERLRSAEVEDKKIMAMREQMIELEQQLILAKQRYREASEEVEGIRTELDDLKMQTDEYREKYMKAQQTVEEQKNQLDMKNLETTRYQEQFMLEFQRVKTHFQSKLEELTPYPEMLNKIQNKLREAVHLKALAEKNCMVLSKNLDSANEERERLKKTLDEINKNKSATEAEKASLQGNLTDGEKRMEETKAENTKLKARNSHLEEQAFKNERRYEEKTQEVLQLQSQLETLREESARQVARTKDYCENVRKSLLNQISELEKQVAAAKATAKLAQQDRDLIRQKMQAQITHLNDNLEQAQMRIRNLQSHVNYLKSSFTNMIAPVDVPLDKMVNDENT